MATSDQRIGMLSQALAAATDVYKENSRILALLDDKAQKTAGVAGIFLAAAFAFLRRESIEDLKAVGGVWNLFLLGASIALFLGCMISSGRVMWARKLRLPPDPNKILQVCNLLLADAQGPSDEARENHVRDQIGSWNRANQEQDRVISDKSTKLLVTQWLLTLAIMAVAILLCLLTFATGVRKASPREIQLIPALQETTYGKMHSMRQRGSTRQQFVQGPQPGWARRSVSAKGRGRQFEGLDMRPASVDASVE